MYDHIRVVIIKRYKETPREHSLTYYKTNGTVMKGLLCCDERFVFQNFSSIPTIQCRALQVCIFQTSSTPLRFGINALSGAKPIFSPLPTFCFRLFCLGFRV
jgi:hypothetical protein